MPNFKKIVYTLLILAISLFTIIYLLSDKHILTNDNLLLLIPDSLPVNSTYVKGWRTTAEEEGLHLTILHDKDFLNPLHQNDYKGIILPDTFHKQIGPSLIGKLYKYVENGGQLMLVFDAGTLDNNGNYRPNYSALSKLAGINYALYDKFKKETIQWNNIGQNSQVLTELGIPPGKAIPSNFQANFAILSTYQYGEASYPYFTTTGEFPGKILLATADRQLVAGIHSYGKGKVLFVNTPISYLWSQTDGLLMHIFLHYFAVNMLALPYLASVPDGIGGIIMNIHVDSNAALKPLKILHEAGLFDQGPYSIDFTAGPDTRNFGDGLGLNISNNKEIQYWIRYFLKLHYAIGDHGGWIHDYFGKNVNDNNQQAFEPFLKLNDQAIQKITSQKTLEYSAPLGNQPDWVTNYLSQQGFNAYYTTGNSGLGPVHSFQNNHFSAETIFAFPNLPFGKYAAFEEFYAAKISPKAIEDWLMACTNFSAEHNTARLIYFHPPGAIDYLDTLKIWLTVTKQLINQHLFRWYTMPALAEFLFDRRDVKWAAVEKDGKQIITASHPKSLLHQTWIIEKAAHQYPILLQGQANIVNYKDKWLIVAGDCKYLKFSYQRSH